MVEKHPKISPAKKRAKSKPDQGKASDKATGRAPKPVAVDRPGFDLGGSTGKTSAGSGLGLGKDAFDRRGARSLPRRGGKRS